MKKVLIADDEEPVRLAMRRLFTSAFGCEVLEAADGMAALGLLGEHDDLALAVVDITMPVVSGLEILEVIRESPVHATLPVIVFTGNNDEHSARRAIEGGASDFILKPFRLAQVRPRIEHLLNTPRPQVARSNGDVPHAGPVLVIDESEDFQHLVNSALAVSHEVLTAASGVAGLELCRERTPFAVLIGPDTGLLHGALLAQKIRDVDCTESVLIQVRDEDEGGLDEVFDASMTRTYVPETFKNLFRQCYERRFSLSVDLPVFNLIRRTARSAAQQALGMLAQTDVNVSVLPEADRRADDVVSRVTLTMWKGTMAVDMELRCSPATARKTAASVLGADADSVTPEDAQSAVGELANLVAGRLQGIVAKDFGPARFTIPKTEVETAAATSHVQLALRAEATDSDATFDLLMSARPLRVRTPGIKAA